MDDGARDLETSSAMVGLAVSAGTTDIVATPHANLEYKFQPDLISARIDELQGMARSSIRIHRGCDFHLSFDNIQDALANPTKYTINHHHYLLVEFSDLAIFHTSTEILARLLAAGMVPVITHPERNPILQNRLDQLRFWVGMGCLLQVTGQSLLGDFGSRIQSFSEVLLKQNLVHFLASDAHDTEHRPPCLDRVRTWTEKKYSASLAERLTVANPKATLTGAPLPKVEDKPPRKWYQFRD